MSEDSSGPGGDRQSSSGSAITDRTVSDVFASQAADGPAVDTDAILDGTSPGEIIERTNEPEPSSSIDPSLFDEAELTELILPERRSDGTFLWVETTDSEPDPDTDPAPEMDGVSIRTWQDPEYDRPQEATTARSTAMTDASEPRRSEESTRTTSVADSTGFESDDTSQAGKVPPRSAVEPESRGGPTDDSETGRSERDRNRADPASARETGSQSRESSPESESETPSKSEIRTSVQHFEHRKPDGGSSGVLASVKRVASRVFRPGRSG